MSTSMSTSPFPGLPVSARRALRVESGPGGQTSGVQDRLLDLAVGVAVVGGRAQDGRHRA